MWVGELPLLRARLRRSVVGLAAVLLLVGCHPAAAWAGDVEGTVTIRSAVAPRAMGRRLEPPRRGANDTDSGYGGYGGSDHEDDRPAPRLSKTAEARFVVLYLLPLRGSLKATPGVAYMRQQHKAFVPHVLPVVRGTQVVFVNDDHILHNIYSPTEPGAFEIPKYGHGASHRIPMGRAGPVELFCGIHSRMNGYVFVVDNDYFAMPDARRQYLIRGVPAGTYWLKAWHPRTRGAAQRIVVPASGTLRVDVTL